MSREDWLKQISDENPEALQADGFEGALLGVARQFSKPPVLIYDYQKCIEILMERDGMDYEDATEHFSYNVQGAWVGDGTPMFLYRIDED